MSEPVSSGTVHEFVAAVLSLASAKTEDRRYLTGTVSHTDLDGTVWVNVYGGINAMPVARSTASYSPGDQVSFSIENGVASMGGNVTDPAAGGNSVVHITRQVDIVENRVDVVENVKADRVDTDKLAANVANIEIAMIDKADISVLESDYAQIDLANVNNAWIDNGVIDKAAIFDAAVFDLTGDTATIKEINADSITVRNLHTKNLVVDSAEGYVTIGDKKTPTKEYLDSLKDELQQEIDGAVETFTADHVPLLSNYPASDWADDKTRAKHVGDICYVQKAGDDHDGFCYRFSYDSTQQEFSWVLIKDSSVTKALGDITDLKTFQSDTETWIEETDEGLTTIRENHTQLSGVVDGVKATADAALPASTFTTFESTTFKTVQDDVSSQSTKFNQLTTTLGTNADGTTKENDIVHRASAIEQDVSGFKQTVSETYATKTTVNGIEGRVSTAESTITQHATDIEAKVSKDGVIAAINLSTEQSGGSAVKINADKVNITGEAVFSAINNDTGTTKINGGKIDTESITIGPSQVTGLVDALKNTYVSIRTTAIDYAANTATLEATLYVDGTPKTTGVAYAWLIDGTDISGATAQTYPVPASSGLGHAYSCKVTY